MKKIRNLIQRNTRNYYKVIGTNMYIAKNYEKDPNDLQLKYDLTMYKVGLNKKDKKQLQLTPLNKNFKL